MTDRQTDLRPGPFDLEIERRLAAPRSLVWRCWTETDHFEAWFAPKPVVTQALALDVRPGGAFDTAMTMPDGSRHEGYGCFLEVVDGERLVFTDAVSGGFRPNAAPFMTAIITLSDIPEGTLYRALVLHKDEADKKKHEDMGFFDGWATAIDQLDALAQELMQ